jgi:precorrin-6B C5,15-methyltransferase / cobalt-precorrin-6B C5,C15-methyltransferase
VFAVRLRRLGARLGWLVGRVTLTVAVVGIGEDGLDGLRPDARRAVEQAEVLVGGERHQRLLSEHPAERIVFRRDVSQLAERVDRLLDMGRRVVVLASGDPVYFGIGPLLVERLGAQRVRVYSNVGAVQTAFARVGLAWQDARVLSAHGRPLEPVIASALSHARLAILTDTVHTPANVARALLAAGMEAGAETWCMERLGGPAERIQHGSLAESTTWTADPLNVLVIERDPARVRGRPLAIGLPETAYAHERGQITKAEVRALSLVRLAPRPGDIVWDIGAGSGSVSVEAAGLCAPSGVVYAVEKRAEQQACISLNIQRYGLANVELVTAEAPEALGDLPDPDAVFVGGSGGRLESILDTGLARLRAGGRVVLNLATLEGVQTVSTCFKARGLAFELIEVSIARGTPLGDGTRLAPLNPVFVVSFSDSDSDSDSDSESST